jgi:peptidoglycan/xylan/chitin deacetylase (PgdA/CDA1 family)
MNQRASLNRRVVLRAGLGFAGLLLMACGGGDDDDNAGSPTSTTGESLLATPTPGGGTPSATLPPDQATPSQAGSATQPAGATSTIIPSVDPPAELSPEQLQQFKPNELGQVPVLEYHQFGAPPEQFMRTPDQFRSDLQWLYEHNFYVISLRSFLDDAIDAPSGKRPVILTFDDSHVGQFRLTPLENGQFALDPDCAIAILETFFGAHPDFGRGGVFGILPQQLFNWPSEQEQNEYGQVKVDFLVNSGYELSNHSYDHVSLAELSTEEIIYQICAWNDWVHTLRPDVEIDSITLPYGMYPVGPNGPGDDTLFRGCEYEGRQYSWRCALQIGANPATPPIANTYDPYAVARIQAFDEELFKWFDLFESDPGILYVSDGNPNTVTIPNDLHPWLVDTLDDSKVGARTLVRY